MATEVFAETLDNVQHSTRLIPESRSFILNSSREKRQEMMYLLYGLPILRTRVRILVQFILFFCERSLSALSWKLVAFLTGVTGPRRSE
jgi:hypothetical protein